MSIWKKFAYFFFYESLTANHIYVRSQRNDFEPGQEMVLYGRQGKEEILLEEIAKLSERSEYNLLSRLNPVLPRFYLKPEFQKQQG